MFLSNIFGKMKTDQGALWTRLIIVLAVAVAICTFGILMRPAISNINMNSGGSGSVGSGPFFWYTYSITGASSTYIIQPEGSNVKIELANASELQTGTQLKIETAKKTASQLNTLRNNLKRSLTGADEGKNIGAAYPLIIYFSDASGKSIHPEGVDIKVSFVDKDVSPSETHAGWRLFESEGDGSNASNITNTADIQTYNGNSAKSFQLISSADMSDKVYTLASLTTESVSGMDAITITDYNESTYPPPGIYTVHFTYSTPTSSDIADIRNSLNNTLSAGQREMKEYNSPYKLNFFVQRNGSDYTPNYNSDTTVSVYLGDDAIEHYGINSDKGVEWKLFVKSANGNISAVNADIDQNSDCAVSRLRFTIDSSKINKSHTYYLAILDDQNSSTSGSIPDLSDADEFKQPSKAALERMTYRLPPNNGFTVHFIKNGKADKKTAEGSIYNILPIDGSDNNIPAPPAGSRGTYAAQEWDPSSPNGVYPYEAVYCGDVFTSIISSSEARFWKRVEIGDVMHLSESERNRLSLILENTYPYVSESAAAELLRSGAGVNLSTDEIIIATQWAIWETVSKSYNNRQITQIQPDSNNTRIQAAKEYLMGRGNTGGLQGNAKNYYRIKQGDFDSDYYETTGNVRVTLKLNKTVSPGDRLKATISAQGRKKTVSFEVGQDAVTLELTDVEDITDVTVKVTGTQELKECYYYYSKDLIMAQTQSMVNCHVYGENEVNLNWTLPSTDKTMVEVEKEWKDGAANHTGQSVTVHLLANGKDTGKVIILGPGNGWKGEFTDLPKYDKDENKINYTVKEDRVSGYKAIYSDPQGLSNASWVTAKSFQHGHRYLIVKEDGSGNTRRVIVNDTQDVGKLTSVSFAEATGHPNNKERYTWTAKAYPTDVASVQYGNATVEIGGSINSYSLTANDGTERMMAFKGSTGIGTKPHTDEVYLGEYGFNYGEILPGVSAVYMKGFWSDPVVYPIDVDQDGGSCQVSTKAVRRVQITGGYTYSMVTGSSVGNFSLYEYRSVNGQKIVITNEPIEEGDEETALSVKKIWTGDTESDRPAIIEVDLLRKQQDESDDAYEVVDGKTAELNVENGWKYSWTELPKINLETGKEYVYSAREKNSPRGYSSEAVGPTAKAGYIQIGTEQREVQGKPIYGTGESISTYRLTPLSGPIQTNKKYIFVFNDRLMTTTQSGAVSMDMNSTYTDSLKGKTGQNVDVNGEDHLKNSLWELKTSGSDNYIKNTGTGGNLKYITAASYSNVSSSNWQLETTDGGTPNGSDRVTVIPSSGKSVIGFFYAGSGSTITSKYAQVSGNIIKAMESSDGNATRFTIYEVDVTVTQGQDTGTIIGYETETVEDPIMCPLVTITNTRIIDEQYELPETGGRGAKIYIIIGLLFICAALGLYALGKRE